jgi:hypothetical protein
MPLTVVLLMATMGRIGSVADYSSELARGFMAVTAFTATLTIAMILITVIGDRFPSVESSRSITSMRTRRETGEVTWGMPVMRGAVNTALELRADTVAAAMVVAGAGKRKSVL